MTDSPDPPTPDVRIPRDLAKRRELYELAGLSQEERAAIDQWCFEQAQEDERRRRRGLEAHGNDVMP